MKFWIALIAVCIGIAASSCATRIPTAKAIRDGHAELIEGSIAIFRIQGNPDNATISALVVVEGQRRAVEVFASSCSQGVGSIELKESEDWVRTEFSVSNLLVNGRSPSDRLFAQICKIGLPKALEVIRMQPR